MKTTSCLFLIGITSLLAIPHLIADSANGTETVKIGELVTSNWRSDDFKGTAKREWDPSGSSFKFTWNTDAGDQIGRIGVSFGSSYLGPKISDMAPECVMSTKAVFTPATDHWFYWSIYGWTHPQYTYWSNTPHGWDNEFYIVCFNQSPLSEFTSKKEMIPVGSVVVDGMTYDCFHVPRASQSQWWAVARTKTWTPSVNIKKIFDFWRSKGMGDEYIVDLGWALEGFVGSAGTLQLTDVHIPRLAGDANGTGTASGH